jgi:hypothetical protein
MVGDGGVEKLARELPHFSRRTRERWGTRFWAGFASVRTFSREISRLAASPPPTEVGDLPKTRGFEMTQDWNSDSGGGGTPTLHGLG